MGEGRKLIPHTHSEVQTFQVDFWKSVLGYNNQLAGNVMVERVVQHNLECIYSYVEYDCKFFDKLEI